MHSDKCNLSDPQYRLWARMITNGIHSSKETPPQVLMITGLRLLELQERQWKKQLLAQ